MALISFWLHLEFLVSSCSSFSSCPCVPRVPLFHVSVSEVLVSSQFGDRQPRVKKHPKTALKIATHDS